MPTSAYQSTEQPLLIGGEESPGAASIEVRFPWDESLVATAGAADPALVTAAIEVADSARPAVAALSRFERAAVLDRMAAAVEEQGEELALTLVMETGKRIVDSRAEVVRTVATLRLSAEAARALVGEQLPLDLAVGFDSRLGFTVAEPVGVVAGLNAVNFPLLIAAHKLGPAIGAGCPIVIKPPDRAPLATLALARIALQAGWPGAAISVVSGGIEVGVALTTDPRVRLVSFTGSSAAGLAIARQTGAIELLLELGSNAATIVAADADPELAVARCAAGGFSASGQSCISVQRVLVQRPLYEQLVESLAARVAALRAGDPREEETDVGPLIDDRSAARVESLIEDAKSCGAEVLVGGSRQGRLVAPTLIAGLDRRMRLNREEAFGPVIAVGAFDQIEEAVEIANATPYGLQAGVFTSSVETALRLAAELEVGGVHVNEVSNYRPDQMPYGGVKESGIGKEGPRYAMERMTHFKVVTLRSASGLN